MILGAIVEAIAEVFLNAQLRKRKKMNRILLIGVAIILALAISLGLILPD